MTSGDVLCGLFATVDDMCGTVVVCMCCYFVDQYAGFWRVTSGRMVTCHCCCGRREGVGVVIPWPSTVVRGICVWPPAGIAAVGVYYVQYMM